MVQQPIQEGGDGGGVAEELAPVLFERRGLLEALASSATRPGAAGGPAPPADPPRGEGAPPPQRPGQFHITSKSAPPSVGKT